MGFLLLDFLKGKFRKKFSWADTVSDLNVVYLPAFHHAPEDLVGPVLWLSAHALNRQSVTSKYSPLRIIKNLAVHFDSPEV